MSINIDRELLRAGLYWFDHVIPDIKLFEIDLESVISTHGINKNTFFDIGIWSRPGVALDPSDNTFYWFSCNFPTGADDKKCIIMKINSEGQIVASRYATDRRYHNGIIANGGKLYAIEQGHDDDTLNLNFDELSKTDLSLVQNIVSFDPNVIDRTNTLAKASDTVLCLVAGLINNDLGNDVSKYVKIDVVAKTKTIYSVASGSPGSSSYKSGNYLYCDRYQEFTGNYKINLTDFTWSAMGTPPSTTTDLTPMFEYSGKIFHGEEGSDRSFDQEIYWYNKSTEAWTEISQYPFNDDYVNTNGAIYFPNLGKALIQRGASRYYSTPADVFILDVASEEWHKVTHLFDHVAVPYNTAESTDARVQGLRLSGDASCGGITIDGNNHECTGGTPQGFLKEGVYYFIMNFLYRWYDTSEHGYVIPVFGMIKS